MNSDGNGGNIKATSASLLSLIVVVIIPTLQLLRYTTNNKYSYRAKSYLIRCPKCYTEIL